MNAYLKAIVGAIIAGLAALATALADNGVTALEWVGVATAVVVAFGGIYFAPNKPAVPTQEPPL